MPARRVGPPAPRARHGRRHDPPGGRPQRARGELHQGLLRRPGDRRPAALQGQAQPPPARAAADRARRSAATRSCSARSRWARSAPRASPPASARSRWRSCGARPARATRCRGGRRPRRWSSCRSTKARGTTDARRARSRGTLSAGEARGCAASHRCDRGGAALRRRRPRARTELERRAARHRAPSPSRSSSPTAPTATCCARSRPARRRRRRPLRPARLLVRPADPGGQQRLPRLLRRGRGRRRCGSTPRAVRSARAPGRRRCVLDLADQRPARPPARASRCSRAARARSRSTSRIAPGSGPLAGSGERRRAPRFAARRRRALPRLRRALERRRPDRQPRLQLGRGGAVLLRRGDEDLRAARSRTSRSRPGPTATNFPIPWLVSTRGFGVLIDQTERSTFQPRRATARRLARRGRGARASRFTVFAGPEPGRTSCAATRRTPAASPTRAPWIFGPWFQPTLRRPYELASASATRDVPVTVAQTYTHYLPCGAHVGNEPRRARARSQRATTRSATGSRPTSTRTSAPTYQPVYDEAARDGLLVQEPAGQPYVLSNPFTADQQVSEVDFTNPGGAGASSAACSTRRSTTATTAGWRTSASTRRPTRVFADGRSGLEMHNRYPVLYHCASTAHTAATRRATSRCSSARASTACSPTRASSGAATRPRTGAAPTASAPRVHQALSIGLSGIAYWGSDIGGFHAIANPRTDRRAEHPLARSSAPSAG